MSSATGRPRLAVGLAAILLIGGVAAALAIVDSGGRAVPAPASASPGARATASGPALFPMTDAPSPPPASGGTVGPTAPDGSAPASAAASPAAPADLATDGRIAFIDASGTLFTIAPDGSDRRQLGVAGQPVIFPAWSPDGRHIAAIGADNAPGVRIFTDRAGASVAGPQGTSPTSAPIYVEWSPSGSRLAYLANQPPTLALHVVEFDGVGFGVDRAIAGGQPIYWAWAADSASLLVHAGGAGPAGTLHHVDLAGVDGGAATDSPGLFGAPGIDRAGGLQAWIATDSNGQQLVLHAPGAGTDRIVAVPGPTALEVDPTGGSVAWIAANRPDVAPSGPLHLVDAATGSDRVVVADPVVAFFWAPDGRHIAVLTTLAPDSSGGSARTGQPRIELAAFGPRLAAASPTLRVLVLDVTSGAVTVLAEFSPPPLFATQLLPFFDQYAASHSIWSPQGDAIVLPAIDDTGQAHLSVVPIDGRPPLRIADGIVATWGP